MREIVANVTERGQVTIPSEVRKLLGLKGRQKIVFAVEDGHVHLRRPGFNIESAYGSLKPIKRDVEEAIRQAKEERAAELVERMRDGGA